MFSFPNLFKSDWIFNHLKLLITGFFLIIIYIRNGHLGDKLIRDISKTEVELEDLKIKYKLSKAKLNSVTNEKYITQKAIGLGLVVAENIPFTLIISKDTIQNGN